MLQPKCNVLLHIRVLIFIYMHSVFSVPPPSFSLDDISHILRTEYSMEANVRELYSDRDQNFHVSNGEDDLILKVSNPAEERSVLDMQELAYEYIYERNPLIQIPRSVGRPCEIKKNGDRYLIRLLSFVPGDFLDQHPSETMDWGGLGQFLGRFSLSLEDFDHPGAHREFMWDARQTDLLPDVISHIDSKKDQDTVFHFVNAFEKRIPALAPDLRMAVIHNDGNEHNILVGTHGEMTGIIDFGDMVYTFQVVEPSVAMAYAALKHSEPYDAISTLLKGYHSVYPLRESELAASIYLMCTRLCITVSMAAWRKKLFPDNSYLTISESSAWNLLRNMQKEDLAGWSDRLIQYAG